jgi:hypothetical protein
MPDPLVMGIVISLAIFLFAVAIGSNLFTVMVKEKIRHLQLMVTYAPLPATGRFRLRPDPVSRYLEWAIADKDDPAGCAHIRYTGRARFGKNGRWMKIGGKAFFSLAVPGFVWHATIACAPGIWIETLDYYVHRKAGMNFNLFSFFPLNNTRDSAVAAPSLFRYLASAPLFPGVLASSESIAWEEIDDTGAMVIIHDGDIPVKALARFNGKGLIESITIQDPVSPLRGHPVAGVFACRFSGYAEMQGSHIPMQVVQEQFLPDGEYCCMEYFVTGVEYDMPKKTPAEVS